MAAKVVISVIALILILGVGGYFLLSQGSEMPKGTSQIGPAVEPDQSADQAQSELKTIDISNYAYSPSTLTINVGDTITWTNKDSVGHTVTSDSGGELNSQLLSKDSTYTHTFTTKGTFAYHCTPHPMMKGTIVVN